MIKKRRILKNNPSKKNSIRHKTNTFLAWLRNKYITLLLHNIKRVAPCIMCLGNRSVYKGYVKISYH